MPCSMPGPRIEASGRVVGGWEDLPPAGSLVPMGQGRPGPFRSSWRAGTEPWSRLPLLPKEQLGTELIFTGEASIAGGSLSRCPPSTLAPLGSPAKLKGSRWSLQHVAPDSRTGPVVAIVGAYTGSADGRFPPLCLSNCNLKKMIDLEGTVIQKASISGSCPIRPPWPRLGQELHVGVPLDAGAQAHGHPPPLSQALYPWSQVGSAAARTQTGPLGGCRCHRQQFNLLHHNTTLAFIFKILQQSNSCQPTTLL